MTDSADQELAVALARVVDRLRSLTQQRLTRPLDSLDGRSLAQASHEVSAWCVAAEAGVVHRSQPAPPAARELPVLAELSAGDQLQVVAVDLLGALAEVGRGEQVWLTGTRVEVASVRGEFNKQLAWLRAAT